MVAKKEKEGWIIKVDDKYISRPNFSDKKPNLTKKLDEAYYWTTKQSSVNVIKGRKKFLKKHQVDFIYVSNETNEECKPPELFTLPGARLAAMEAGDDKIHLIDISRTKHYENEYRSDEPSDILCILEKIKNELDTLEIRRENYDKQLSYYDKEINDIKHAIEFEKFNAARGYYLAKELNIVLQKRRVLKENMEELCIFEKIMKESNEDLLNSSIEKIRDIKNTRYIPRIRNDLFKNELLQSLKF